MMVNKKCSCRVWSLRVTFSDFGGLRVTLTGMDVEMVSFRSAGMKQEDNRRRNSAQQNERFTYRLEFITVRTRTEISIRQMTIIN